MLKFFYEHEARSDATTHLLAIKSAYHNTQGAINNNFASNLVRKTGLNLNVVLCESGHIVGTTVPNIAALNRHISEKTTLCTTGTINIIDGAEHYLAMSEQINGSLLVVDIEPLYNITAHVGKAIAILLCLGIFIIALGVTAYALVARKFLIRPIRRLQARVAGLAPVMCRVLRRASWPPA